MPRNLGMFHQWSFRRMQVQGTSMFASLFKPAISIFYHVCAPTITYERTIIHFDSVTYATD